MSKNKEAGCWAIIEAQSGRRYFGKIVRLRGQSGDKVRSLSESEINPEEIRKAMSSWSCLLVRMEPVLEFEMGPGRHPATGQMVKVPVISPPGITTDSVPIEFSHPGAIYFVSEMKESDRAEHENVIEMAMNMGKRVEEDAKTPLIHHPSAGVPKAAIPPELLGKGK